MQVRRRCIEEFEVAKLAFQSDIDEATKQADNAAALHEKAITASGKEKDKARKAENAAKAAKKT